MKRYRVIVEGREYEVEIEDLHARPISVAVDGETYEVELEALEDGERPARRPVVRKDPSSPPPVPTARPTGATDRGRELVAPMPGLISEIRVSVGQEVQPGQELCKLEAMKMKNSVKSPRDGVIAAVRVTEGQSVAHGDILFVFE